MPEAPVPAYLGPLDPEHAALHADLVLWTDAWSHAEQTRASLAEGRMPPHAAAFWRAYIARMESHAAALSKRLVPQRSGEKHGR